MIRRRNRPFGFLRRRSDQLQADVDEELRVHLAMRTDEFVAKGLSPDAARREALRQFGDLEHTRRYCRDQSERKESGMRVRLFIDDLAQDLRHSVRQIARHSGFAAIAVLTLALGIGASAAIFSIVNAVLLRPLPLEEPDRLVRLFTITPGGRPFDLSAGKFHSWQRESKSFERMAAFSCCGVRDFALTGAATPHVVTGIAVSAEFFDVLRARPALGRTFGPEDDRPGGKYAVVLSDKFWRHQYGSDRDAIGRDIRLNDLNYRIVGVLPPVMGGEAWPAMTADVYVPLGLTDEQRASRGNHNLDGVARLKPGVTVRQAQAELDAISERLGREFPKSDDRWSAAAIPLQESLVGSSRAMLLLLGVAVCLVLCIACTNVGNLLFGRALSRHKEIAIRSALGAGRGRVFRQLLTEALMLAVAGGALGVLLAHGALTAAATILANAMPRGDEISIDARVLLFAGAVSMVTGVLAGTLPAVRAGRSDVNSALKEGGRGAGSMGVRTRQVLIVGEVALSLVLLMGAGVMVQSLLALRNNDAGFDPKNVLTMNMRLVDARYPTPAARHAFFAGMLERMRALPGVDAAGTIDDLPSVPGSAQTLTLEGYPPPREPVALQVRQISAGYLKAMRIPVIRGRDIEDGDGEVLLVSREAAKLYWGTDDPLGRRAALPGSPSVQREVIGIVGEVKQRKLTEATTPTVYFSSREPYGKATLVVRSSAPPELIASSAVAAIREVDPQQPVSAIQTMDAARDGQLSLQRFSALLLAMFAAGALLLAVVGIYGVLSFIVRGRGREIGIRAALGARKADVLRMVLLESLRPTVLGIAVGAIVAVAAARMMDTLVFGLSPSDPRTFAVVTITLLLAALAASLVPAYRALRLDPVKVLRGD